MPIRAIQELWTIYFMEKPKAIISEKAGVFKDYCKLAGIILMFCPVFTSNADQLEKANEKEQQTLSGEHLKTEQRQKKIEQQREIGVKKRNSEFTPSARISADVPVSFPADI